MNKRFSSAISFLNQIICSILSVKVLSKLALWISIRWFVERIPMANMSHETNHSPPPIVEIKGVWHFTSTTPNTSY
jgi:hypothetical protein